jgi:hypothetical protein
MKHKNNSRTKSIIVLIVITLLLTSCNNELNSEIDNLTKETLEKVDVAKSQELENVQTQQSDKQNVIQDVQKEENENNQLNNHIIKDNNRVNQYYSLLNKENDSYCNRVTTIYEGDFITETFNINGDQLEFNKEVNGINEKNYLKQLNDDEVPFYISNNLLGVNTDNGIKIYSIFNDDNINMMQRPQFFTAKAKGNNIFEYDSRYFIEFTQKDCTYLLSKDYYSIDTKQMLIEGNVLDIKKIAYKEYLVVVKMEGNQLRFMVINDNCTLKFSIDYHFDEDSEYKDMIINTYNSYYVYFNKLNHHKSYFINLDLNKKIIQGNYQMPFTIEEVLYSDNTYIFDTLDENKNKNLFVCDRKYMIIDQINFESNVMSKFSNIELNNTHDINKTPFITAIVNCNKESFLIKIDIKYNGKNKKLINIDNQIDIDESRHLNNIITTYNEDGKKSSVVLSNFDKFVKIKMIENAPYFIMDNELYSNSNGLITKVKHLEEVYEQLVAIKIGDNCYAFFEDDKFVFTSSLNDDYDVEKFYNRILTESKKPKQVCIDDSTNEAVIEDENSIYTLSYSKGKDILTSNIKKLGLKNDIKLYKKGAFIFVYDEYNFYSYDNVSHILVQSTFKSSIPIIGVFHKDSHAVIYYSQQLYLHDNESHLLREIKVPQDSNSPYIREYDGKLMCDDYYYDFESYEFKLIGLIEPKKFTGVINNKYYYPMYSIEMVNVVPEEVILYATPFIRYNVGEKDIEIVDYQEKNGIEYILEYETNHLYKVDSNQLIEIYDKEIREYDISNEYLAFTSYMPNEKLYLYDYKEDDEIMIVDNPVDHIYMDGEQIYYQNLIDNNIWRYDIEKQETFKVTNSNKILNVFYSAKHIIYQEKNDFIIMTKDDLSIIDSVEGNIMIFDKNNNQIYYNGKSVLTLIYNIDTKKNEVYSNNHLYCYGLLDNKIIGEVWYDGPGAIGVVDKKCWGGNGGYKTIDTKMNEQYTISDIGVMYGLCFLVYNNDTLKYHELVSYNNYVKEKNGNIIVYYDTQSVYFKRLENNETEEYKWIKYTPATNKEEILDSIDKKGLKVVEGRPRPA